VPDVAAWITAISLAVIAGIKAIGFLLSRKT